jgi:hypothetical protein
MPVASTRNTGWRIALPRFENYNFRHLSLIYRLITCVITVPLQPPGSRNHILQRTSERSGYLSSTLSPPLVYRYNQLMRLAHYRLISNPLTPHRSHTCDDTPKPDQPYALHTHRSRNVALLLDDCVSSVVPV